MGREEGAESRGQEPLWCGGSGLLALVARVELSLPPRSPFGLFLRVSEWDRAFVYFKLKWRWESSVSQLASTVTAGNFPRPADAERRTRAQPGPQCKYRGGGRKFPRGEPVGRAPPAPRARPRDRPRPSTRASRRFAGARRVLRCLRCRERGAPGAGGRGVPCPAAHGGAQTSQTFLRLGLFPRTSPAGRGEEEVSGVAEEGPWVTLLHSRWRRSDGSVLQNSTQSNRHGTWRSSFRSVFRIDFWLQDAY